METSAMTKRTGVIEEMRNVCAVCSRAGIR